jgi:hypothetical protein
VSLLATAATACAADIGTASARSTAVVAMVLLLLLPLTIVAEVSAALKLTVCILCYSALQCEPWVKAVLGSRSSSSNSSSSSSSSSSSLKRPRPPAFTAPTANGSADSKADVAADVSEEQKPPADPVLYKALLQLSLTARGGNHGVLSPQRLKAAMDAHSDRYGLHNLCMLCMSP